MRHAGMEHAGMRHAGSCVLAHLTNGLVCQNALLRRLRAYLFYAHLLTCLPVRTHHPAKVLSPESGIRCVVEPPVVRSRGRTLHRVARQVW